MLNDELFLDLFVITGDSLVIIEEIGPLRIHGSYSLGRMTCYPSKGFEQIGPNPGDWRFACKWDGETVKTSLSCPPDCEPLILKAAWYAIEDLNHRSAWFDESMGRKKYFAELERDRKFLRMATTVLLSGHDTGVPVYLKADTEDFPSDMPECAVQWACRQVNGIKQSEQFASQNMASA